MSAGDVLRASEASALNGEKFFSSVSGKYTKNKKHKKLSLKSLGAAGFITVMLGGFLVFFSMGNLVPAAISDKLIEATDVQYADAVESKLIVFAQALEMGDVPDNTANRLKNEGVLIGYMENGNFIENNKSGKQSVISYNDEIISASSFASKVKSDVKLYNAFNNATYDRAAYYYDESARKVFQKIGTNRNNYNASSDFDMVMSKVMGEGSNININNVSTEEVENEDGETSVNYITLGDNASSSSASLLVNSVNEKNYAANTSLATLNAADSLNTADKISREQRSSLFFLAFMENISKMKAGQGSESKINEAMNYLYRTQESEVVDVKTGEVVKVSGSMMESPSLYAILTDGEIKSETVINYSSDRVLNTVENIANNKADSETLDNTVTSSEKGVKGTVGRFTSLNGEKSDISTLEKVTPIINSSLVNNSFSTIGGVSGGEFLVEGAVNVGAKLAKASGATPGDAESIQKYAKVTNTILALDRESDKLNRSPLDISSRNTFLGSIFYSLAVNAGSGKIFSSISGIINSSLAIISPIHSTYASDSSDSYLSTFGECTTLQNIGAVGSVTCSEIATFDTSTLGDIFNDAGFRDFINKNTTLDSSGTRVINKESKLADFILYNDERVSPLGVIDSGILNSINNGSSSIPFVSNFIEMIQELLGAPEENRRIASGASFVNSTANNDWNEYKYAQRYISLARATDALRQYDGEQTAYSSLEFFEGNNNPVIAFLNNYYNEIANN